MWPALQAATVLLARGTKKNLGELLCGGRFRKRLRKTFRKQARFITRKRKNPKGNTLYTKNPNEDPQKCDPPKLKTHTHENRTRNNADVKVSERACRSRACGSARHTSSVLSSLFPNSHNSLALVLEGHRFSCSLHEEIGCRGQQLISFFLSQLMTWCWIKTRFNKFSNDSWPTSSNSHNCVTSLEKDKTPPLVRLLSPLCKFPENFLKAITSNIYIFFVEKHCESKRLKRNYSAITLTPNVFLLVSFSCAIHL